MQVPARLGPYEIRSRLGAGGMGEVYRARDTRLNRDVAIKVLPEALAQDAERLARFRREAQLLAALNHPHIAAIYGLESAGDVHFLVLELIEGETLADRLRRGALPVKEALTITAQICDALASAHERGIIHRDLKPANIALTSDDRVKVLDFGLARSAAPPVDDRGLSDSPTITAAGVTSDGVILGTAPYMSPEQAKGRVVDKRSDVFAVGCVLYEMLTGRRAFAGETVTETLANVIKSEPDWQALPAGLPPTVMLVLRGTLEKDRKTRIADLSTVSFLLDRPVVDAASPRATQTATRGRLAWLAVGLAVGAGAAAALFSTRQASEAPPSAVVARFSYGMARDNRILTTRRAVAISPDGTRVAVVTIHGLWLRQLADPDARLVPGTEGALVPVFAPDGTSLVFWHEGALKRLAIGSTSTLTLCTVGATPNYLSWTGDTLLYTQGRNAIMRVAASGGTPVPAIEMSDDGQYPSSVQLLPDGDTVLLTMTARQRPGVEQIEADVMAVQSLRSGERTPLATGGSDAQYVRSGHILYVQRGSIYAVPFDPRARRLTGDAIPVLEGVSRATAFAGTDAARPAHFAVSESGTLVYLSGPVTGDSLDVVLLDEAGKSEPLNLPPGSYRYPRVSSDGARIAFDSVGGPESMIMIHDRANPRSVRRLTFGGHNRYPVWTPDGRRVTFQSDRDGDMAIFWQSLAGGAAERLTRAEAGRSHIPESWSPDGQVLLFQDADDQRSTLKTLTLKDRTVEVFGDVRDSYLGPQAVFSPDGKWVAYQFAARENQGEATTFIEPYPRTGTKHEVGMGGRPVWSRDGTRLFYVPGPSLWMAVNFRARPEVSISSPQPVPRLFSVAPPAWRRTFDLLPDGRVVAVATLESTMPELQVVVNWLTELKGRVAAKS